MNNVIFIGAFGQIFLKEELLNHLKVQPGHQVHYRLLPNQKLLIETQSTLNQDNQYTTPAVATLSDYRSTPRHEVERASKYLH